MSQDASRALVSATTERTTIESTEMSTQAGWPHVLDAFLNTLDSAATKREYRRDVESAMAVLGDLEAFTAVALTEYRDRWVSRMNQSSRDHLSPSSVTRHLAAMRSFLRFARLTGQTNLPDEVIRFALKSPRVTVLKPYQVLSEEEKTRLVAAAEASPRDRVLLSFVLATGLRASEVCALQVRDESRQ